MLQIFNVLHAVLTPALAGRKIVGPVGNHTDRGLGDTGAKSSSLTGVSGNSEFLHDPLNPERVPDQDRIGDIRLKQLRFVHDLFVISPSGISLIREENPPRQVLPVLAGSVAALPHHETRIVNQRNKKMVLFSLPECRSALWPADRSTRVGQPLNDHVGRGQAVPQRRSHAHQRTPTEHVQRFTQHARDRLRGIDPELIRHVCMYSVRALP